MTIKPIEVAPLRDCVAGLRSAAGANPEIRHPRRNLSCVKWLSVVGLMLACVPLAIGQGLPVLDAAQRRLALEIARLERGG